MTLWHPPWFSLFSPIVFIVAIFYENTMKTFALFEFCKDKSCAVGKSEWILDQDHSFNNEDWDESKEVLVHWPKPKDYAKWSNKNGKLSIDPEYETTTYVTRILKFSGKF